MPFPRFGLNVQADQDQRNKIPRPQMLERQCPSIVLYMTICSHCHGQEWLWFANDSRSWSNSETRPTHRPFILLLTNSRRLRPTTEYANSTEQALFRELLQEMRKRTCTLVILLSGPPKCAHVANWLMPKIRQQILSSIRPFLDSKQTERSYFMAVITSRFGWVVINPHSVASLVTRK